MLLIGTIKVTPPVSQYNVTGFTLSDELTLNYDLYIYNLFTYLQDTVSLEQVILMYIGCVLLTTEPNASFLRTLACKKTHINGSLFPSELDKTESYEASVANMQPCQTLHYFQYACIFYIKYQGDTSNLPKCGILI